MRFNKKAQQYRNDMLTWYLSCFGIVLVFVVALYGFGIIGDMPSHGSLINSNQITAAAVAIPIEDPVQVNETEENSSLQVDG